MSHSVVDKANKVRPGEELDAEAVHEWLSGHLTDEVKAKLGGLKGSPAVTQYSGGACIDLNEIPLNSV